jgi:hypothetical protein
VAELSIGDIGIGNNITLATFNRCFGFTKTDAGEIAAIKARV